MSHLTLTDRAYNVATKEGLTAAGLDEPARERLRLYLVEAEMGPNATLFHKPRSLDHLPLYPDTASKLTVLSQHRCPSCPLGDEFPVQTFPIGVPPWSHQCSAKVGPALRQAIDASPNYTDHFRANTAHGAVCMRIVFVLGDGATMKDCDNMAKGLLDAFQGLLYINDRQVEHLDLIKVHHHPGAGPGYVLVRVAPTTINNADNVLVPMHAQILWMNDLDVDRFLPPEP